MSRKFIGCVTTVLIMTSVFLSACSSQGASPSSPQPVPVVGSSGEETTSITASPPMLDSPVLGDVYNGQGASVIPITKDPGFSIVHIRMNGCSEFTLRGTGYGYDNNAPLIASTLGRRQASRDFDGRNILGQPRRWNDGDTFVQPQLTSLVMDVGSNCLWSVGLLPISAAVKISRGAPARGAFDDVLEIQGSFERLTIVDYDPPWAYVSIAFMNEDGMSWAPSYEYLDVIDQIPAGYKYILVFSQGDWELALE
jgi:hypothetical protein